MGPVFILKDNPHTIMIISGNPHGCLYILFMGTRGKGMNIFLQILPGLVFFIKCHTGRQNLDKTEPLMQGCCFYNMLQSLRISGIPSGHKRRII